MLKVLDARVVNVKYKMRRRGSALLIVVVLVLMLAMMGTAFIMTVRISRDQITGTGSTIVILPEADYWPAIPTSDLDAGGTEVATLIQTEIQNSVRPGGVYRDPAGAAADFAVSPQGTNFLAARYPTLPDMANISYLRWDGVSHLAGHDFATPLAGNTALGATRANLVTSYRWIQYPQPFNAIPTLAGKTRVFPGFNTAAPVNPLTASLAADADGDGVADSGLFPLTATSPNIVLKDAAAVPLGHPVTLYGAVRVVDNAGAVNVNTAWRSTADRDFTGTDIPNTSYLHAYLGTFRPNVGLYELLRGVTATSRVMPDSMVPGLNTDFTGPNGLDIERMGDDIASTEMIIDPGAAPTGTPRADAVYITQSDAIEHQLVRRLNVPGYNYDGTTTVEYASLESADLRNDLAYHGSLLNTNMTNTAFRTALNWSAYHYSPNYSDDMRKRFRFFGANQYDFWYHTIYNTDSTTGAPVNPYVGTRATFFDNAYATFRPSNPIQFNEAGVRKTARQNLTSSNAISTAIPDPVTAFSTMVAANPAVATATPATEPNKMPNVASADTPVKANANTSTFGELWRSYWSIFASQPGVVVQTQSAAFDGNVTTARRGTAWVPSHQQIVRAALAAVNTITARNPELTYFDPAAGAMVTVPGELARAESRTFTVGGHDVTVYGVRKQPFITEVLIQRDETGVKYVAVELYNPYPTPLAIPGHSLAALNGNTLQPAVAITTGTPIPANGYLTVYDGDAGASPVSITGTAVAAPGLLAMIAPGTDVVLLRTRRDDGTPSDNVSAGDTDDVYNEANVYDLIPIDQFYTNITDPLPAAGSFDRYHYVRSDVSTGAFKAVWAGDLTMRRSATPALDGGTLGNSGGTPSGGMEDDIVIPLANTFSGMLHPLRNGTLANPNRFPFGAFARDGDVASVPYIGHYRVSAAGAHATIQELNSVAVDATFAKDNDLANDANEPLGRFVSMVAMTGDRNATETYEFANRLFDYVTAVDVSNDADTTNPEQVTTPQVERTRWTEAGNATAPTEVEANSAAIDAPTQGRVNINTASWQVLAALPLVPGDPDATERLAKAIVIDRETNGEFESIYDLNRVTVAGGPRFMDALGVTTGDFTFAQGDLSPADTVMNDYEQRIQELTRISNLITTRSDSFTAYILVQAWIDANSANPVMAAERRYVIQVDRSKMTKNNGTASLILLDSQMP